jgi:hypothetical protein
LRDRLGRQGAQWQRQKQSRHRILHVSAAS